MKTGPRKCGAPDGERGGAGIFRGAPHAPECTLHKVYRCPKKSLLTCRCALWCMITEAKYVFWDIATNYNLIGTRRIANTEF